MKKKYYRVFWNYLVPLFIILCQIIWRFKKKIDVTSGHIRGYATDFSIFFVLFLPCFIRGYSQTMWTGKEGGCENVHVWPFRGRGDLLKCPHGFFPANFGQKFANRQICDHFFLNTWKKNCDQFFKNMLKTN